MNKTVFSQLDERWRKLPYPNKTYTIGSSGCGCVSVTHILIETEKYKDYTPKNVQPYMKQFAVPGNGTTHAGIQTSLEHYGFKTIDHATMGSLFKTLNHRKKQMGILIFRDGTRGGVTWTTWGHCIAFVDYKIKNKKHYFYTKDSGGRHNTGWFCYEDEMKGLIVKAWSAYPTKATKLDTDAGSYTIKFAKRGGTGNMDPIKVKIGETITLPKCTIKRDGFKFIGWSVGKSDYKNMKRFQLGKVKYNDKAKVKDLAKKGETVKLYPCWKGYGAEAAALWARLIAKDNSFMYGADDHSNWYHGRDRAHQCGCYFCGTTITGVKKAKKGSDWEKTYCCNQLVFSALTHGANLFKKCRGGSTKPEYWTKLKVDGEPLYKIIGANVKYKDLRPGDIMCSGTHVKMYTGKINGIHRVTHAAGEGWTKKSIRTDRVAGRIGKNYTALRYVGR